MTRRMRPSLIDQTWEVQWQELTWEITDRALNTTDTTKICLAANVQTRRSRLLFNNCKLTLHKVRCTKAPRILQLKISHLTSYLLLLRPQTSAITFKVGRWKLKERLVIKEKDLWVKVLAWPVSTSYHNHKVKTQLANSLTARTNFIHMRGVLNPHSSNHHNFLTMESGVWWLLKVQYWAEAWEINFQLKGLTRLNN